METYGSSTHRFGEGPGIAHDFSEKNLGPHERPLFTMCAPCLSFHSAFWYTNGPVGSLDPAPSALKAFDTSNEHVDTATFDSFVDQYMQTLLALAKEVDVGGYWQSDPSAKRIGRNSRTWITSIKSNCELFTIKMEAHTEYWTFTIALTTHGGVMRPGSRLFPNAVDQLGLGWNLSQSENLREHLVDSFGKFVWEAFRRTKNPLLVNCFATFFGNIFWLPVDSKGRETDRDYKKNYSGNREFWNDYRYRNPLKTLEKIWLPICQIQGRKDGNPAFGNTEGIELTASTFLDRRAIYASSLGHPRTPPLNAIMEGHIPVVYSLFVCNDDSWQLGRLIDNIHALGTLRLAALHDLPQLQNVAAQITKLAQLRQSILIEDTKNAARDILELNRKRALDYRIERSRRYWQQFQSRCKQLRIGRIEGFQPYDDFVRRRIGDTVDFVDGVGKQELSRILCARRLNKRSQRNILHARLCKAFLVKNGELIHRLLPVTSSTAPVGGDIS